MIQIDMQMPNNCLECPACNEHLMCAIGCKHEGWVENDVSDFSQSRPQWCPMKEQKTGHWVEEQINSYTRSTTCSECGGSAPFVFVSDDRYGRNGCGKDELTKYCPNCGAKMEI